MGDEAYASSRLAEDTSRRRLLTLMGAGGAAALAALLAQDEAQAGHDATNVMHLGESNSASAPTTIDANNDGPMLLLNNAHATGTSLHAHKPLGVFTDVTRPGMMVVNDGEGGGGIEALSRAGGIGIEGQVIPTEEELEFEDQKNGYGVRGISSSSFENYGDGPGVGVHGSAGTGTGVLGMCVAAGIGVEARSDIPEGAALRVRGKAWFSTGGSGVVPMGQSSVFVSDVDVTEESHISVTLVSNPGARSVSWVERDPNAGGFTVHMSPASPNKRPETFFTYLLTEPLDFDYL